MTPTLIQATVGLISVALFVFCDFTAIRWAERIPSEGYLTWMLLYLLVAASFGIIAFGFVGARMGLAVVSGFVNTGIVAGGVFIGILFRGEQLTAYQKIGLAFGIVAILLLNMGKSQEPS
ncbi:MAG TPA: hypothetical protein VIF81_02400 [Pyrinomonadaceae bacterium]|jgi:drug/metabolite transporter (DMT)-like permease